MELVLETTNEFLLERPSVETVTNLPRLVRAMTYQVQLNIHECSQVVRYHRVDDSSFIVPKVQVGYDHVQAGASSCRFG